MTTDPYMLFTQCNVLYVQGVRHALRERLQSTFGDDWWDKGVLPALHEEQRAALATQIKRNPDRDRIALLDSGHFGLIVRRYHAVAFSDVFGDASTAYRQFRIIAWMRNEWAHVQEISMPRVIQVIETMKNILASLRRREALDIEKLNQSVGSQPSSMMDEMVNGESTDNMVEADVDYISAEPDVVNLNFWDQIQSYLTLDTFVEFELDKTATITVRISNTATESQNTPQIYFKSIRVTVRNSKLVEPIENYYDMELGPGQAYETRYKTDRESLVFVEFDVTGQLDIDRFLRFNRKTSPSSDLIESILAEFVHAFEAIDIKSPLATALDSIGTISPDITLSELASVRTQLKDIQPLINEKTTKIDQLYSQFHLDVDMSPGGELFEISSLLRQLDRKLNDVDDAISNTDLESIAYIVNDLEQIQLAILRIESTIKEVVNR